MNRVKMSATQRAKQFAPFDAVVGLRRALKEKEKIKVPKRIVSEDMAQEINRTLISLQSLQVITVLFYNSAEQEYVQLTGRFSFIDEQKRILVMENTQIPIDNIYRIILN